ncbi:hypothetical protein C7441_11069 [Pseudaminobacter salicylatoxidans]|uniref:Uncharacterized protein n=1 Tax=Pseudaminobacter salicylatoxidans TaxID=93369 RepID=A0A316C2F9_PSESE|nr:hypothetical protein [Pseudaminobacter salicylatoxidans]PWJ81537.1 hypothetical protein C7441_11069 [Pseudaminobacter salicylatoxidans]
MTADLIARLENLTGSDREVDAEIVFDLFASPVGKHKEDGGPIGYIRLDDQPSWNLGLRFPGKDRAWFHATRKQIKGETLLIERDGAFVLMNSMRVPEITASLDAAVALVERVRPGWKRSVFEGYNGLWIARISSPRRLLFSTDYMREMEPAGSPNGAIALLIALFRSLEAEGARDDT